MAIPIIGVAALGVAATAVVSAGVSVFSYFSAEKAKHNAENTKNLAELERAHSANPTRKIQAAALVLAVVGASFVGYKYVEKKR